MKSITLTAARSAAIALLLSAVATTQASTCSPSESKAFNGFFARFSTDKAFSVERTSFPLRTARWEYGTDDAGVDVSAPVWSLVSKDEFLGWRTIAAFQRQEHLAVRTASPSSDTKQVTVFREGSDMEITYKFLLRDGCWRLVEFLDRSL